MEGESLSLLDLARPLRAFFLGLDVSFCYVVAPPTRLRPFNHYVWNYRASRLNSSTVVACSLRVAGVAGSNPNKDFYMLYRNT